MNCVVLYSLKTVPWTDEIFPAAVGRGHYPAAHVWRLRVEPMCWSRRFSGSMVRPTPARSRVWRRRKFLRAFSRRLRRRSRRRGWGVAPAAAFVGDCRGLLGDQVSGQILQRAGENLWTLSGCEGHCWKTANCRLPNPFVPSSTNFASERILPSPSCC